MSGYELTAVQVARRPRFRFRRPSVLAVVAVGCVAVMALLAVFGPYFTENPNALSRDVLQSPSGEHWFGTDNLGRDYFARTVHGARLSISLAAATMVLATVLALAIGVLTALFKGPFDLIVQRIIDMALAFPGLILVMFLVSLYGASFRSLVLSLSLLLAPGLSRVVRSSALAVVAEPYVEAARVLGASSLRIVLFHVIPNIVAPMLVYVSTGLGVVILAEGGLSFLGLGVAPPQASWGKMLSESRTQLREPWLSIFPGLAITIAVLGTNLLGDVLRDRLNPRLRQR